MSQYGIHRLARVMQQANEAAAFQYNANLFHDITAEIAKFRQDYKPKERTTKNFRKTNLDNIIQKHTGFNIVSEIAPAPQPNAFVLIPNINRSNPIFNAWTAQGLGNTEKDIDHLLKQTKEGLTGEVDIKRGHVTGFFAKMPISVHVTTGLMNDTNFNADEVAAIILHELGHVFSLFESMNRTIRRNWILESRLKDFRETGDRKVKLRIMDDLVAEKYLNRDFPKNEVLEAKDGKGELLILTKSMNGIVGDPNTATYDNTAFESASDQFAVRMGAGRALASGMAKLYGDSKIMLGLKYYFYYLKWTFFFSRISAMGYAFVVLGPVLGAVVACFLGFATIMSGMIQHFYRQYDDGDDRIMRMKQELVGSLKDRSIPEEIRKDILADFDEIERIYKESKRHTESFRGPEQFLVEYCIPFCIANRNSKHYQQTLEALQNNDLYAAAVRFE